MQARHRYSLVTALLVGCLLHAACDGSKPRPRGGAGGMAAPQGQEVASPRSISPLRPSGREIPRPRVEPPQSSGPTGLKECDQALDVVCRCAKSNPSLEQPCRTLGADAPAWKVRAKEQDPGQIEDLRKACRRILSSVQEAYGCR